MTPKHMRKSKFKASSSPPEHLLVVKSVPIDNGVGSLASSYSSSLCMTPPSSLNHKGDHSDDGVSSNGSSLSVSPSTPKKEWEVQLGSHLNLSNKKGEVHSKMELPNIMRPKSLPSNSFIGERTDMFGFLRNSRKTRDELDMSSSTSRTRRIGKVTCDDDRETDKVQWPKPDYNSGDSDYSNSRSGRSSKFTKDISDERITENHAKAMNSDSSTRGGNIFAAMFKRPHRRKKGRPDRELNDRALKAEETRCGHRSCSSLDILDTTMRGGETPTRDRNNSDYSSKFSAAFEHKGMVIGPGGLGMRYVNAQHFKTQTDTRKEKKLMFTDLRNSKHGKDSGSAYLGEEKSTHRGQHFDHLRSSKSSDGILKTVEEESIAASTSAILSPIKGVETWSQKQKYPMAPAIIAMCRSEVFSNHVEHQNDDKNIPSLESKLFGSILMGSAFVASLPSLLDRTGVTMENCNWQRGCFVLRQNYLLEYESEGSLSLRPRGYAFLQGAVVRSHHVFEHTIQVDYLKNYYDLASMSTLLIRSDTYSKAQRWLECIQVAAKLKVEDLYQYSSEVGSELGLGRYAIIHPGRRRRLENTQSNLSLSLKGRGVNNDESASGILKKKPSFSSFNNLTLLAREECECALKIINKKKFWASVKQGTERSDSIVRETCVQSALFAHASEHPGFLRLKNFFETRDKIVLELELLEGTDLYQYIKKKQPLSELEATSIMSNILSCIVVMERLGIAHRDLKPANIMMAKKSKRGNHVCVGDFGNSTFVGSDNLVRGRCGTVGYVAPEILSAEKNSGYENKVDTFSAGVILYVLLCGYEPFYGETEKQLIQENKRAHVEFPEEDWQSVSVEGRDLVEKLLQRNPSKRISAANALQHPWITIRVRLRETQAKARGGADSSDDSNPIDETSIGCVIN
mmetsp:Transcript_17960/g.20447  ORF Transcript_17960/g.20447 Transcript_17960/m.20447 type:complete len:911 (+) Transcript_17960:197-2929(+)